MSGSGQADLSNSASAVEDIAAGWVVDRQTIENWTAEKQAEFDMWLAQSVAHRTAYLRVNAGWKRTDRLTALRNSTERSAAGTRLRRASWSKIAVASCLAVGMAVLAGNYLTRASGQIIETPRGGHESLMLADGTHVELNTDSAISVQLGQDVRNVELLRGEASFQVKHDAARAFVVTVAKRRIVDLGTKFLVRLSPGSFEVALLEGRARLEGDPDSSQQHAIVLSPGEIAVATEHGTQVSMRSRQELLDRLAWQHGMIVLHEESLARAAEEFNRYGGPKVIVVGQKIAALTVNGAFQTTGAEDFAANMHEIFGLQIEHQNGSIVLSR
jgi:transmembrane sensor